MWLTCSAIGAVTRHGIGYDPDRDLAPDGVETLTVPDFDVREELGRKGSSTLDRLGALALLAARDCLGRVPAVPGRTGVTVATTVGSMRSTLDFSGITLTSPKPWNVPPSLFPNTVMNAAAGRIAIQHTLTGPNTTIAGGKAAGHKAVSYAGTLIESAMLSGCLLVFAEEATGPRAAWAKANGTARIGEAAVALLVSGAPSGERLFRMRRRDGAPEHLAGSVAVTAGAAPGGWPAADVLDAEEAFGFLDAATFGCQVLMALGALRSGRYARAVIPFPAGRQGARAGGHVEVAL